MRVQIRSSTSRSLTLQNESSSGGWALPASSSCVRVCGGGGGTQAIPGAAVWPRLAPSCRPCQRPSEGACARSSRVPGGMITRQNGRPYDTCKTKTNYKLHHQVMKPFHPKGSGMRTQSNLRLKPSLRASERQGEERRPLDRPFANSYTTYHHQRHYEHLNQLHIPLSPPTTAEVRPFQAALKTTCHHQQHDDNLSC